MLQHKLTIHSIDWVKTSLILAVIGTLSLILFTSCSTTEADISEDYTVQEELEMKALERLEQLSGNLASVKQERKTIDEIQQERKKKADQIREEIAKLKTIVYGDTKPKYTTELVPNGGAVIHGGKPTPRWRFNDKGYSQAPADLDRLKETDNTNERLLIFLEQFGASSWYNTLERLETKYNTKKEVVVCITYADTTVGKYMSTPNNPGNVGNNDRGDRVGYSSINEGLEAIFQTLNNKYLGHYTEVRQLSHHSNPEGKFYAGDTQGSWISNVLNCLGMINDTKIDGSYGIHL